MEKIEQYIQEHTKLYGNYGYIDVKTKGFTPWITPEEARKVAKIAREETINEVCELLKNNISEYVFPNKGLDLDWFIEYIKRELKK